MGRPDGDSHQKNSVTLRAVAVWRLCVPFGLCYIPFSRSRHLQAVCALPNGLTGNDLNPVSFDIEMSS